MPPTKFQVNWPRRPSWISDRNDFSYFLQVTLMLPTKFQVNWPFGSGEKAIKKRFSRWRLWRPSMISYWNDFSYVLSTNNPDASYYVSSQLATAVSMYFRLERF